jgi:hypothetical protein
MNFGYRGFARVFFKLDTEIVAMRSVGRAGLRSANEPAAANGNRLR